MMTEKLKPCPFCGGTAKIEWLPPISEYVVECLQCGIGSDPSMSYRDENELVKLWNTRASEETANELIKDLRASADGIAENYEDFILVEHAIGIVKEYLNSADENPPLTLDELREMEGEPVWTIEFGGAETGAWEIVGAYTEDAKSRDTIKLCSLNNGRYDVGANLYGETWIAYRRKPEEVKE